MIVTVSLKLAIGDSQNYTSIHIGKLNRFFFLVGFVPHTGAREKRHERKERDFAILTVAVRSYKWDLICLGRVCAGCMYRRDGPPATTTLGNRAGIIPEWPAHPVRIELSVPQNSLKPSKRLSQIASIVFNENGFTRIDYTRLILPPPSHARKIS